MKKIGLNFLLVIVFAVPINSQTGETTQIPKLIENLADKDERAAGSAAAALIEIGPAVVKPLIESLKKKKLCEFQFNAAEVIRKIDKRHPAVKSTLFEVAGGKCEFRYDPEKYLPDANFGSVISMFNAAEILATEIDGGIILIPELMKGGGVGLIGGTRALVLFVGTIDEKRRRNQEIKPEIIGALKATIPMLADGLETENARKRCDFYKLLDWMQKSGFNELQSEAGRALQGKAINCPG